jgi:hypothetical protein
MSTTVTLHQHGPSRAAVRRAATRLATIAAGLGVLAGVLEISIGPSIRDWVGNKQDTTRLGLTTIALSAVALAAAASLSRDRPDAPGHRLVSVLGIVVSALVCFTTVGRLWLIPGPLLLVATALLLTTEDRKDLMHAIDQHRWRIGLVSLCGAYYIFLGATALGAAGVLGIIGGLLIWGAMALASRSHRVALVLLIVGALPFAVATWWSVITPLIAAVALALGRKTIRHTTFAAPGLKARQRAAVTRT